jgi:hypothetical protein
MDDWVLIPCLKQLFAEFNTVAPHRDKASDGSIGDTAHQEETSDHNPDETGNVPIHDADHVNEVHAIDVTSDLRTPGLSMEDVVQHILARCRSGAETRLRYVIYYQRIWEAKNGWRERAYTGSSQHREHAHFGASYDSDKEASTASWTLGDLIMTQDDIDKIVAAVLDAPVTVGSETWRLGTAVGYAARKAYEIDKQVPGPSADDIAAAVVAHLPASGASTK